MRFALRLCLIVGLITGCRGEAAHPPLVQTEDVGTQAPAPPLAKALLVSAAAKAPVPKTPRVPVLDCTQAAETGYRKGRKFPITVVSIDGRPIESRTADAYWAMQAAAATDGIELPIYSAFRTHEDQLYFFKCFKSCSCNSCSPAARPGHSNHQSGRAIDFGQWDGVVDWLRKNGKRFRFFATVPKEPWHWEYRPKGKRRRIHWPRICATLGNDSSLSVR